MKPTKRDFDAAVKQKWLGSTCLLAQCLMREGFDPFDAIAWDELLDVKANEELMTKFDAYFQQPGDETKPELVALREQLPE